MTDSNPFSSTDKKIADRSGGAELGLGIVDEVKANNNHIVSIQPLTGSGSSTSFQAVVSHGNSGTVWLPSKGDMVLYALTDNSAPIVLNSVPESPEDTPSYNPEDVIINGLDLGDTGVDVEDDGTLTVSNSTAINFGENITVTDDGDNTVTVDGSGGSSSSPSTFVSAYQDEATDQSLTDGSTDRLSLDVNEFDTTGESVDLTNNQLIIPSDGYYIVGCNISAFNGTGTTTLTTFLFNDTQNETLIQGDERANSDGTVSDTFSGLFKLNKGDTVYLLWRPVGSGMTIDGGPEDTKLWFMRVDNLGGGVSSSIDIPKSSDSLGSATSSDFVGVASLANPCIPVEGGNYLYATDPTNDQYVALDISDPLNITLYDTIAAPTAINNNQELYAHSNDTNLYHDTHVITLASNGTFSSITDISSLSASCATIVGNYAFITYRGGSLWWSDVSTPTSPTAVTEVDVSPNNDEQLGAISPDPDNSNIIWINLAFSNDTLAVDISNPENPVPITGAQSPFETTLDTEQYAYDSTRGVLYFISSPFNKLNILDIVVDEGGSGDTSQPRLRAEGCDVSAPLSNNFRVDIIWGQGGTGAEVNYDSNNLLSSDGKIVTAPESGIYNITARVGLANVTEDSYQIEMRKNGLLHSVSGQSRSGAFFGLMTLQVSEELQMNAGDTLEWQVAGGSADVNTSDQDSAMTVRRVGDIPQ